MEEEGLRLGSGLGSGSGLGLGLGLAGGWRLRLRASCLLEGVGCTGYISGLLLENPKLRLGLRAWGGGGDEGEGLEGEETTPTPTQPEPEPQGRGEGGACLGVAEGARLFQPPHGDGRVLFHPLWRQERGAGG
jgi:hypothetical protein